MDVRRAPLLLVCVAACGGKKDPAQAQGPQTRAPAVTPSARSTPASRGAESSASTLTECPKALAGAESVNRVITRECGVVAVNGEYHLNNGSLTLEAGATLAFHEGASLNIGYNDSAKLIVR